MLVLAVLAILLIIWQWSHISEILKPLFNTVTGTNNSLPSSGKSLPDLGSQVDPAGVELGDSNSERFASTKAEFEQQMDTLYPGIKSSELQQVQRPAIVSGFAEVWTGDWDSYVLFLHKDINAMWAEVFSKSGIVYTPSKI